MSEDVCFEIEQLSVRFSSRPALKSVSLKLKRREVSAIIGPSGCGKSTLLRCLNRLVDLDPEARVDGAISLKGQPILGSGVDVIALRARVGMVFQKPNPFPLSVFENIAYGLRVRGIKRTAELDERVELALRSVGLWTEVASILLEPAARLSLGQQQRLMIARAIAVEPEVLLLDEPASALDPISTLKIEELIFALKERFTVILVTHNMQQAARVSDFTAFLSNGELIEAGDTARMFTNPTAKATEDYITGRTG